MENSLKKKTINQPNRKTPTCTKEHIYIKNTIDTILIKYH